jgi:hypothetical protein
MSALRPAMVTVPGRRGVRGFTDIGAEVEPAMRGGGRAGNGSERSLAALVPLARSFL